MYQRGAFNTAVNGDEMGDLLVAHARSREMGDKMGVCSLFAMHAVCHIGSCHPSLVDWIQCLGQKNALSLPLASEVWDW